MTTTHISGKHEHEAIVPIIRSYHETTVAVVNIKFSDGNNNIDLQSRADGYNFHYYPWAQDTCHALTLHDVNDLNMQTAIKSCPIDGLYVF